MQAGGAQVSGSEPEGKAKPRNEVEAIGIVTRRAETTCWLGAKPRARPPWGIAHAGLSVLDGPAAGGPYTRYQPV
jgi:hypothetical protein